MICFRGLAFVGVRIVRFLVAVALVFSVLESEASDWCLIYEGLSLTEETESMSESLYWDAPYGPSTYMGYRGWSRLHDPSGGAPRCAAQARIELVEVPYVHAPAIPAISASNGAKWTWTWCPQVPRSTSDYRFEYDVVGTTWASALVWGYSMYASYLKLEAFGWAKLVADTANSSTHENEWHVAAGAELRSSVGAFTGIGVAPWGVSISWDGPFTTDLMPSNAASKYVHVSGVEDDPGSSCFIQFLCSGAVVGSGSRWLESGSGASAGGGLFEGYEFLQFGPPVLINP